MISFIAALALVSTAALAQSNASLRAGPNALLAIDQHRASVVEHIVATWGAKVAQSSAMMSVDELRTALQGLRADRLLAASIAGGIDGLREVLGIPPDSTPVSAKPASVQAKALGDLDRDALYTPVTPCRLVETRGTFPAVYQGNGSASHTPVPFTSNQIRTYTLQGGNGVCLTQLPAGLNVSAVQLQVFGIPTTSASGDIEILPQGTAFGSTATMVYVATIPFNTVSTAASVNLSNNQISVQVRGGGANLAIDVVGYFRAAGTATATEVDVNGQRVMRYEYNATSPNVIGGHPSNSAAAGAEGDVIAGGGFPASGSCSIFGKSVPCNNLVSGTFNVVGGGSANSASGSESTISGGAGNVTSGVDSTIAGGLGNTASGNYSIVLGGSDNVASGTNTLAAGHRAKATTNGSFIWADSREFDFQPSVSNFFGVRATGGVGLTVAIDPSTGGVTQFCNLLPGVPSWQCVSDRNAKENFVPVDSEDILRRLVAMPLSTWNMKGSDPALRSLGPVAQDFHAAFGLGTDDKTIAISNVAGVALAAIQGLHQIVEQKDAELKRQDRELTAMKQKLEAIEAKLGM